VIVQGTARSGVVDCALDASPRRALPLRARWR
jgi:hypothetical protein